MRDYDKQHGWLWHCDGGPMGGMDIRMTANQQATANQLPPTEFPLDGNTSGVYRLVRKRGKRVRWRGRSLPVYRYVWVSRWTPPRGKVVR